MESVFMFLLSVTGVTLVTALFLVCCADYYNPVVDRAIKVLLAVFLFAGTLSIIVSRMTETWSW